MRSRSIIPGIIVAGLLAWPAALPARLIEDWPYEKLFKAADLVVFATAVKREVANDKPPAHSWNFEFAAHNTTFKINHTLKGKAEGAQLELLHFKFGELKKGLRPGTADVIIENGPLLVAFRTGAVIVSTGDGNKVLPTPEYLLFLRRLMDGRYEPVSGRIDPALSVKEVSSPFGEVLRDK